MQDIKKLWAAVIVVAIIAVGGYAFPGAIKKGLGGVTNYDALELSAGLYVSNASTTLIGKLKVGSSGTSITGVNSGICYFSPSAATIAGSVSQLVDCQGTQASGATGINTATSSLTGVTAADHCSLTLSTTTALGLGTTTAGLAFTNKTPLILAFAGASTSAQGAGTIQAGLWNSSTSPYLWAQSPIASASGTAEYVCTR